MYARFGAGEDRTEGTFALLGKAVRYGRHLVWPAVGAVFAALIATIARLAGPLVVRGGVDDGVLRGNRGAVLGAAGVFVVVVVVQYFSQAASQYGVAGVGERFLRDLRVGAFSKLIRLDLDFYSKNKSGVLVARMTSDIEALAQFVLEGAVNVITSTLTVIGVAVAMFFVDVQLAWTVLALMPPLLIVSVVFRRFADRAYQQVREQIGQVLGAIQEGFSGVRVVQAYTQEGRKTLEFGRVNEQYYDANMAAAKAISSYFPAVDFLRTVGTIVILYFGGRRVLSGDMSAGSLLAFLLYLNWFFEPIIQLSNVYNLLQAALAALSKLFGILDREPSVKDPDRPRQIGDVAGGVRFHGVHFGYDPSVPVIGETELVVAPGERVAVVGETGAGKSTIAKLAVRFYDPTEGMVTLDDHDLREVANVELRRHVVLVPQEGFLFSGSLRENIAYTRADATESDLWQVCDAVGITDWVRSLPEGLDTEVRERGSRLSSGERQLVALARALLADPTVIVLDEATSNLDPETEAKVEAALSILLEGRTAIVIAHRLATAERADRVIVMDDGLIVESGSHAELLALGGRYAHLHEVWEASKR